MAAPTGSLSCLECRAPLLDGQGEPPYILGGCRCPERLPALPVGALLESLANAPVDDSCCREIEPLEECFEADGEAPDGTAGWEGPTV